MFSAHVRAAEADAGLKTPLTAELLDNSATADWTGGVERSRAEFLDADTRLHMPNQLTFIVFVPGTRHGWGELAFGDKEAPGMHHLRIGFKAAVPVGTIITRGKLSGLSVLAPNAAYPGDMADEAQWIPARRERNSEVSAWLLPPGTQTRAVRFSYNSPADDKDHRGQLSGVYLMAERYENVARNAQVSVSSNPGIAGTITDGSLSFQSEWTSAQERKEPLSAQSSEWVSLIWPQKIPLRGLAALFPMYGKTEIQVYDGPDDLHPREAADAQWKTVVTVVSDHGRPVTFNPNWYEFDHTILTRAVRVRMLSPATENAHTAGATRDGTRAGLNELLAFSPAGQSAAGDPESAKNHPPIAVSFKLDEAAYVTLAIEDAKGKRVKNLIGDTFFAAGKHTVYWDGLDESGRIVGPYAAINRTVGKPVAPGKYTVRGLTHKTFDLRYEYSVYSPGSPPWLTGTNWEGGVGGWLSDHTPPAAVLFLPGAPSKLLMTSPVAESSHGIIWTDLNGRKTGGTLWVGGNWTGASHLTRDDGPNKVPGVYAYSGVVFEGGVRLVAFGEKSIDRILTYAFPEADKAKGALGGIAAHNGLLLASLPNQNQLVVIDAAEKKVLGTVPLQDGQGLAFDKEGRLLAVSGNSIVRFPAINRAALLASKTGPEATLIIGAPQTVVAKGLDKPQGMALDGNGNIYVGDWGASHQVKVFNSQGRAVRTIGTAGGAHLGPYDETRMDQPMGLTITPDNHLWVAEHSHAPKRVSQWTLDGKFVKAFYGPPQYGGGGTIDPQQTNRFYYSQSGYNTGLEFALDWKAGTSKLKSIYWLPPNNTLKLPNSAAPQSPIYLGGRQYMTDVYNAQPVGGPRSASIWLMKGDKVRPVASLGMANEWPAMNTDAMRARWPQGAGGDNVIYAWSDVNSNGAVDGDEVSFASGKTGSLTVNDRLEFCAANITIYAPTRFTADGVAVYDLAAGKPQFGNFYLDDVGSASGQVFAARDGWTIASGGPVRGIRNGEQQWTYPNEWPGQQAGVFSTSPKARGELMATARWMGQTITPRGSDAGEIWAVNGDKGNIFLMTTDGLFVGTLFHDIRLAPKTWTFAKAERGLLLNDVTTYDEDFWTTLTQTLDGKVYAVAGKSHSSIVRVDGLESARRLKPTTLEVTPELLDKAAEFRVQQEVRRLLLVGRDRLAVRIGGAAPLVDGDLAEWTNEKWATIFETENQRLNTEAGERIEAAVRVAGDRMYFAYKTPDANLLANAGDTWQMLFKTGGALDVMLATNPNADPKRTKAEAGDLRLLVTMMAGKPTAILYRPISDQKAPAAFSSPWRTLNFDQVVDVSKDLQFASKGGSFEFSVPLSLLGLAPKAGLEIKADLGVLRGNGFQTLQRLYWVNKSTSTVADVPTEATLTPQLWGIWRFQDAE